jgi:hypothetical protein
MVSLRAEKPRLSSSGCGFGGGDTTKEEFFFSGNCPGSRREAKASGGKAFFFEKQQQKTFGRFGFGAAVDAQPRGSKVFWFFFSKKNRFLPLVFASAGIFGKLASFRGPASASNL